MSNQTIFSGSPSHPIEIANSIGLSKETIAVIFLLPNLRSFSKLLAAKDANTTGKDDELARVLEAAAVGLEAYLAAPNS